MTDHRHHSEFLGNTALIGAVLAAIAFHLFLLFIIQGMSIRDAGSSMTKPLGTELAQVDVTEHIRAAFTERLPAPSENLDTPWPTALQEPSLNAAADNLSTNLNTSIVTDLTTGATTQLQPVNAEHVIEDTSLVDTIHLPKLTTSLDTPAALVPQAEWQDMESLANRPNVGGNGVPGVPAKIAGTGDFIVETSYAPAMEGGYFFEIRLIPKPCCKFKRISQNLVFLLDRSYSISTKRFQASKKAIVQALESLHPGDSFNVLVFDTKVRRLSEAYLPWCEKSLAQAKEFLEGQRSGTIFAATDLYSSLDTIVPKVVADTEVNVAILLSDGDTFLDRQGQRSTIADWTIKNEGKVSLFCVATGKGNNLSLLDILSSNNKGILAYCKDNKETTKTLEDLIHKIHNPIGKDLVMTIIPKDPDAHITVFPRRHRLPHLYQEMPYVIVGHTDKLSDFCLFLQGKFYDHWFDIKEDISLSKATPAEAQPLAMKVSLQKAYDHYDTFLLHGEEKELGQARALLTPYNVPVAFQ